MDYTITQIIGATLMVIVAVGMIVGIRKYQSRTSERRRLAMLEALGLDPAIATSGDMPAIMRDVRKRCEHCQSEALCERWLRGEETGGNEFCPNAKVFEILRKYGPAAG
jgi:hypothetical protein